jgi:hypothetical protein
MVFAEKAQMNVNGVNGFIPGTLCTPEDLDVRL